MINTQRLGMLNFDTGVSKLRNRPTAGVYGRDCQAPLLTELLLQNSSGNYNH